MDDGLAFSFNPESLTTYWLIVRVISVRDMSVDPLTLIVGASVGVAAGAVGTYLYSKNRPADSRTKTPNLELIPTRSTSKSIEKVELEKRKREMKALLVEKEMLTGAIARVFEAEAEGRLTKEEREQLVGKYRSQFRGVEERLENADLFIEVGELEQLREELVGLFDRKMGQIESRLADAKSRLKAVKTSIPIAVQLVAPKAPEEKPVEKKAEEKKQKPGAEVDDKVKAVRDEVLEALARLEQMDVES
ncbi:MAG: hypothetical protein HYU39_00275 [Thaumarchaeota archaeon]|nr:hypothetical protein [Nitrososphaerota archaeon]